MWGSWVEAASRATMGSVLTVLMEIAEAKMAQVETVPVASLKTLPVPATVSGAVLLEVMPPPPAMGLPQAAMAAMGAARQRWAGRPQ